MNCRQCSYPARVSGVRDRVHGNRMALSAPTLRVACLDWTLVLDDLRPASRNAGDDHRRLVFAGVHDRLLDVVSFIGGRVAGMDDATGLRAMKSCLLGTTEPDFRSLQDFGSLGKSCLLGMEGCRV